MYVLVVAISGGDVVATSVVAKSAPSILQPLETAVIITPCRRKEKVEASEVSA